MRNNQIVFILVGVLFLASVGAAVLSYRFISSIKTLQGYQDRLTVVNYTKGFLNQLAAETSEYAKKDSGINAILQPSNAAATLPPPASK